MASFTEDFTGTPGNSIAGANWSIHTTASAGTVYDSTGTRAKPSGASVSMPRCTAFTPTTADYDVRLEGRFLGTATGTPGGFNAVARMDASVSTFYALNYDFSSGLWGLARRVSGANTNLVTQSGHSISLSDSLACVLQVRTLDASTVRLKGFLDTGSGLSEIITYDDTAGNRITSAGYAGIRHYAYATGLASFEIDRFVASDPAGSANYVAKIMQQLLMG